jgi:hypothetical protein
MLSRKHTTKEIRIKEKKSENRQIELARTPGTRNKGDHVSEFFFFQSLTPRYKPDNA